jgi:hypothetical protein
MRLIYNYQSGSTLALDLTVTLKPEWTFPALGLAIALAISWAYFDAPEATGRYLRGRVIFCAPVGPKETWPSWCRVQIEGFQKPS